MRVEQAVAAMIEAPPGDMGSKVAVIVGSRRCGFPTDATDVWFFSRVNL